MSTDAQSSELRRYRCCRRSRLWRKGGHLWRCIWMRVAGWPGCHRTACALAAIGAPPFLERVPLARMQAKGFISPTATIDHPRLFLGQNVFIDDRVLLCDRRGGGDLRLGRCASIYRDTILATGNGGSLTIGDESSVHPKSQLNAYVGSIHVGAGVMIASGCALYSYDHGMLPEQPIRTQPLQTRGDIVIGDDAWLGTGVIVLSGVNIGNGAVLAAGSVVTRDVPDNAIAMGSPARVVKHREE